jgi:hypothetical protein
MVIPIAFAQIFAALWHHAWNSHDLELILSHYADDVVVESPLAKRLVPESDGVVVGKEAVRAYWRKGLDASPDLEFQLMDIFTGVNCITLLYRPKPNEDRRAAETMYFNDEDKVTRVIATYAG